MINTALEQDEGDWENQLHTMMGERDAEAITKAFHDIIATYEPGEPAATLQIAVGEDDVHEWLPAVVMFLKETPDLQESVKDMLWNLGLQLIDAYVNTDDIAPDPACTEAVMWFMEADADEIGGDTMA